MQLKLTQQTIQRREQKKKKRKGKSKYALLADGHGCRLLVMVLDGKWHDRSKQTDIPHPHLVLLVLPGVRKAGDDSGDPGGGGNLAGVYHDQQLHQIVIDLSTTTLHNVDILPTHALPYLHAARGDKNKQLGLRS